MLRISVAGESPVCVTLEQNTQCENKVVKLGHILPNYSVLGESLCGNGTFCVVDLSEVDPP